MEKTINHVFLDELCDMLSCEQQIVEALPEVIKAAESHELKEALTLHLKETKGQIQRLEKIFRFHNLDVQSKLCKGAKGLIQECHEVLKEYPKKSTVRDVILIAKLQRIEHYEISAYGTMRTLAKELGWSEIADWLQASLDEEASADKKLTKIAEGGLFKSGVNQEAISNRQTT